MYSPTDLAEHLEELFQQDAYGANIEFLLERVSRRSADYREIRLFQRNGASRRPPGLPAWRTPEERKAIKAAWSKARRQEVHPTGGRPGGRRKSERMSEENKLWAATAKVPVREIAKTLGVSETRIYKIRSQYVARV